jgi:integrase
MARRAPAPTNLWLRHRTWFLRLSIPPSLRQHFGGKDKIVESLRTDSLSEAERERDRRVAEYHARFERLRTGAPPTDAEIASVAQGVYERRMAASPARLFPPAKEREFYENSLDLAIKAYADKDIAESAAKLGIKIEEGSALYRQLGRKILEARLASMHPILFPEPDFTAAVPLQFIAPATGETFSQAFEAHIRDLERANTRATTITSYRQMASVFQAWCKDAPLASITRPMASDFIAEIGRTRSNATVNQYAALLAAVFETARRRGRFTGDNGFKDQKRKAEAKSYEPFTGEELATLFGSAAFDTAPKAHTTQTALPWAALIAAYSGLRREEVAQLRVKDLREIDGVWAFDVNREAGPLKTKGSARIVPVHSKLIAAGLLRYHAGLPQGGRLFPSLKGRASKGGKLGARLGDAFERWRTGLGLTRPGLSFHSFRHGVSEALERAAVAETDAARLLGHDIPGMSFGTYSRGPGLKRLKDEIEKVQF